MSIIYSSILICHPSWTRKLRAWMTTHPCRTTIECVLLRLNILSLHSIYKVTRPRRTSDSRRSVSLSALYYICFSWDLCIISTSSWSQCCENKYKKICIQTYLCYDSSNYYSSLINVWVSYQKRLC